MDTASVTHWPLLSLLIWLPILGGVFTLMAGNTRPQLARWMALGFELLAFALSWLLREVPLRTHASVGDAIPPPRDEKRAVQAAIH